MQPLEPGHTGVVEIVHGEGFVAEVGMECLAAGEAGPGAGPGVGPGAGPGAECRPGAAALALDTAGIAGRSVVDAGSTVDKTAGMGHIQDIVGSTADIVADTTALELGQQPGLQLGPEDSHLFVDWDSVQEVGRQ